MTEHLPLILVELLLVGGCVIGFAVWQLGDLRRERQRRHKAPTQAQTEAPSQAPDTDRAG